MSFLLQIVVVAIPLVTILVLAGTNCHLSLTKTRNAENIKVHEMHIALYSVTFQTMLERSERYAALIDKLQIERGISCMHIGATK